jgi:RNA polymerase sigma-70 factor (ECF subfamily)
MTAALETTDPEPSRAAVTGLSWGDRCIRLMGRYCDGEADAFEALYALVAPRLLGYLLSLVGDRATAEDLLQQTFLKLHQARGSYVRGAQPMPWLYTIAQRTCFDELRRRRPRRLARKRSPPSRSDRAGLDGTPAEGDHHFGYSHALAQAAVAALDRLPSSQRSALRLTKLEGRSIAEAAALTGSTPAAIKLRIHRAYLRLRRILAGQGAEELGGNG